jgi:hypothetical protein
MNDNERPILLSRRNECMASAHPSVMSIHWKEEQMKSLTMTAVAAGVMAAAALGFAGPAIAAPAGPDAVGTLNDLKEQGFNVIVNKTGNSPLDQCAVSEVRPGQTYTRMESEVPGPDDRGVGIVTTVLAKTVYLDVAC